MTWLRRMLEQILPRPNREADAAELASAKVRHAVATKKADRVLELIERYRAQDAVLRHRR